MVQTLSSNQRVRSTANTIVVRKAQLFARLRQIDPARAAAFAACSLVILAAITGQRGRVQDSGRANTVPTIALRVPVTVGHGDSLWSLARRYGNPGHDIQDRVETLATTNGLSASDPLLPGQRLVVPVENPVELARLQPNIARR